MAAMTMPFKARDPAMLAGLQAGDEIDTALAGHNGFTAEELDFILNYDIRYRLGRDTEGEQE